MHLDRDYFDEVCKALEGVQEWLLTGPSAAKDEMSSYLHTFRPGFEEKLLAVETADHPTDGQLLDHARRFFKVADRMQPNWPAQAKV